MNDEINCQGISGEPPEGNSEENVPQGKVGQGRATTNSGDTQKNEKPRKPRVKGSHRKGTPPKLKWL